MAATMKPTVALPGTAPEPVTIQNMPNFAEIQSGAKDLNGQSFNFDVQLKGRNPFSGSGYLKVHIAEVVFDTGNV